jgi:DNA-binding transcriptional LysR family regulator
LHPQRATTRLRLGYARGMSLSQLHYFVVVAEEQHLSRAAKKLHISQPPLTRQIRALEAELGAPLFERTARGMRLLPSGSRLLPHAQHILESVERAKRALEDDACSHIGPGAPAQIQSRTLVASGQVIPVG